MNTRNNIFAYLLLLIYTLVALHQDIAHSILQNEAEQHSSLISEQQEAQNYCNYTEAFHIGIFHVLGHLIEIFVSADDHDCEHYPIAQTTSVNNYFDTLLDTSLLAYPVKSQIPRIENIIIPYPPFVSKLLSKNNSPGIALRGPPAIA